MGIFDDADTNARGTEGGIYFVPGNFTVEVQRCKEGKTRKGIPFFVVETKIVRSDVDTRKPGTPCSYMVQYPPGDSEKKRLADGNVMDFMRAAYAAKLLAEGGEKIDVKEVDLTKDMLHEAVGEENPLAGLKLEVHAFNAPTKAGKDFTRVQWELSA